MSPNLDNLLGLGSGEKNYEASTGVDRADVTTNSLNVLRMYVEEQLAKELEIATITAALKKASEELEVIRTKKLPEFMQEHDLPEFKFVDRETGATLKVTLDEVIRISIPKGKRKGTEDKSKEALNFFREIGEAGVIAKEFVVNLGLRDDDTVATIVKHVTDKFPNLDVAIDEKIAPATVTSIITKRLKAGKPVPADTFTIFRQTESNVTAT